MENELYFRVVQHVTQAKISANNLVEVEKDGAAVIEDCIKSQIYIVSLKDPLRSKVQSQFKY